ncbi:MAG: biopolymer transporter ExbD [Desulfurivibrionaceae bacterium]|nr:biopolymer transporter ExbD [Desulfurivibrionaceae bacterium]
MDDTQFDSINVIPFIDIMLVLLTIVLTTSTFIAQGTISVDLPKASASQTSTTKQAILIDIDRQGAIVLDAEPVTMAALEERLRSHERETTVLIRADRQIALQNFVKVLNTVKGLGFAKVSLQTEKI